jgi:hypothetical protein
MKNNARAALTPRALVAGLALMVATIFWVMYGLKWDIAHAAMISLLYNAVFVLFAVTLVNMPLRRVAPSLALTRAELLTVYAMVSMGASIGGHMCVQMLAPMLSYVAWFATPENDWQALFGDYIPNWLAVQDRTTLGGLFEGDSSLYTRQHVAAWSVPLLAWSLFLVALLLTMLLIAFIARRQWTEHEKLSYPLIQLPLELTHPSERFLRDRYMWAGFALAAGIDIINGLHYHFPAVPRIWGIRQYDLAQYFTTRPWNAIDWLPVGIYPFALGLAFAIPLDLAFSCWFFYLLWHAQAVVGRALSLPHAFPYATQQSAGAFLGITLTALWTGRAYFRQVVRKVVGARSSLDDSREPLGYRAAAMLIVVCQLYIGLFCYRAGMSFWVIASFFALFYVLVTGITRMRAELGSPVHDLHFGGPDTMIYAAVGSQRLGKANLTILSYLMFFNRSYDWLTMPHQLEALKMAERARIDNRRFGRALAGAVIVGVPVAIWAYLHTTYQNGMFTGFVGHEAFQRLERWLVNPTPADDPATAAVGLGALLSFALTFLRSKFVLFPFHIAGYAVSSTYTMHLFWFSIFTASVAKWATLTFGGFRAYRRYLPFFLGLALGECVVTVFWGTMTMVLDRSMYITLDL